MSYIPEDVWSIVKEFAIDPQFKIFKLDETTALTCIMTYGEARDVYHLLDGIDEEELEDCNYLNPDFTKFPVEFEFTYIGNGVRRMKFYIDSPIKGEEYDYSSIVELNEEGVRHFAKNSRYDKLIVKYLRNNEADKKVTIKEA
tara:strand:+ start:5495 stop:5923 length:429 start_codon:yes stop_codon:yes gene_type:complete